MKRETRCGEHRGRSGNNETRKRERRGKIEETRIEIDMDMIYRGGGGGVIRTKRRREEREIAISIFSPEVIHLSGCLSLQSMRGVGISSLFAPYCDHDTTVVPGIWRIESYK